MKKQLAADLVRFIKPIREKALALQNDPVRIESILLKGAAKARENASTTLREVRKALGFK
jgi:tryptophanyl-tRNA synthetase